ncbi:MAG: PIN domain-containing protein [Peptococcaceae bacterium]
MRIMIDTNVLLSALVFKSAKMADLLEYIAGKHTLLLCSYIIEEANAVITRKSSTYKAVLLSAITADVDVLITGDKDFNGIDIDRPGILTPTEFLDKY